MSDPVTVKIVDTTLRDGPTRSRTSIASTR